MIVHRKDKASCLPGVYLCFLGTSQAWNPAHKTYSPHCWPHISPHVPESKLLPPPAWSPALCIGKGLLCPGRADKYGNSIFIGCINISVCTYISYIIVQGLKGGPKGRPQQHDSSPFPQSPTRSVQTKANSSCSLFLPGEVTVWGGGQRSKG